MIHHHCAECGESIPNGQAHIRSISFEQVAWCDLCWKIREGNALISTWAAA